MKYSRAKALSVSSAALAAVLTTHVPQASAQTLFDLLFKNNRQERVIREAPPEPAPVRVAPPKISGPSYYTYKTDSLVKVDFAAIRPVRTEDAARMQPGSGLDATSVGSTDAPADRDAPVQVAQVEQDEIASDAVPESDLESEIADALADDRARSDANADDDTTSPVDRKTQAAADAFKNSSVLDEALVEMPSESMVSGRIPDDSGGVDGDGDDVLSGALVETDADEGRRSSGPSQPSPAATARAETPVVPAVGGAVDSRSVESPSESAVEPVTAVAPQPLSDEQIASLQDFELLAEKEAAEAVVAHYSAQPEFIWVSDGEPNDRARGALRILADAASHGLEPSDYAVSVPSGTANADLARFEMELSARLLRYVRDARSGRVDPNRISGYHDFASKPLDQVATLQLARTSEDLPALLNDQHPHNDRYRALRVELEALRASAENEIVIAPKTLIKPGQTNAELAKVLTLISQKADEAFRSEHGDTLTRHLGSDTYDRELVPVIKAAQRANGLGDDGIIGPRTIRALAGESKASRIGKVEVALEQLRWLPSDFGDRHVFINAAAFNASYVENGEEKLSMRTVVGGLGTQTYFFQDEVEYVEFHPYWGVPRSILVNKYLPKLYSDPSYLDRNGFEVVNAQGQRVSSSSVNWGAYGANIPFDVRQKPGGGNALGEMKIMFPNRHAIYMHDTPDKSLFQRDNRALSNGCVRLADPRAMAAAVLGWSREEIEARLAQPHSRQNLSSTIPVYVTYFTAWPEDAGDVAYYNDVYSRDEKVMAAIEKVEAVRTPGT